MAKTAAPPKNAYPAKAGAPAVDLSERVPTGIDGLDELCEGGFDRGSSVRAMGEPGAGKTTMMSQFLVNGALQQGEGGVFLSFEESKESIIRHSVSFGWDMNELEKSGAVAIINYKPHEVKRLAEEGGVTLVLEPLNPIVDHKGYWLVKLSDAADIVQEVGSPNLKILDDLYHQQLSEGNLIANLTTYLPWIGHFHTAGAPGRHELVGGELDYRTIFAAIARGGYTGYVGLEFAPTLADDDALRQALTLENALLTI